MPPTEQSTPLFPALRMESALRRAERRLEAHRQIVALLTEFPELESELGIGTPPDAGVVTSVTTVRQKNTPDVSNFARIRDFFVQHDNVWTQAPRIGEALNLTRGTVATVLWTSHRDQFEQKPVPGSVKKKQWRLVEDVYDDAKTQIDQPFPVKEVKPK